jgi:hypothetical protein
MKTGKWIDNFKEPLEKIEEVQFCMPDPHSGWVDWQEMILAFSISSEPDETYMEYGMYFPEKQEFLTMSREAKIRFENGKWEHLTAQVHDTPIDNFQIDIYAYFPISPLPSFENQKEPL